MDYNVYKEAGKAVGFYDSPYWQEMERKPIYFTLFNWNSRYNNLKTFQRWYGDLCEEKFNTIEKRIAYIQGVFERYNSQSNKLEIANSSSLVERIKKWIDEISFFCCGLYGQGIISHNIKYYIPICHTIEIEQTVFEFIKNYKFNE